MIDAHPRTLSILAPDRPARPGPPIIGGVDPTSATKVPEIVALIATLRERLGADAFDIVDHWEADRCAIGIASPRDHRVLIYLATVDCDVGRYHAELELPPTEPDRLYREAGSVEDIDLEHVLAVVGAHLRMAE